MTRLVIDPEVPERIRHELERVPDAALIRFSATPPKVIPLRRPKQRARSLIARSLLAAFFSLYVIGLSVEQSALIKAGVALFLVVLAAALFLRVPLRMLPPRADPRVIGHVVTAYHRRYVVPQFDLQKAFLPLWQRAGKAADVVLRSDVVRLGTVDSVQVAAVLPYYLWDIAERLAYLSGASSEQLRIMQGLDIHDPDVRDVLAPQLQAKELAIADAEGRIRRLENFAVLAVKADAAIKREQALKELAALNPAFEDALARRETDDNELTPAGRLANELRAAAEVSAEAVKRANQAGRSLSIPASPTGLSSSRLLARDERWHITARLHWSRKVTRYAVGETPTVRWKCRRRVAAVPMPQLAAICSTEASVRSRSSWARPMRC
jgi:hypothetical protein